jgi:hypothetical protein
MQGLHIWVKVILSAVTPAPPEHIHRTRLMSRGASPLAITRALHKGAEWKDLAEKAKNEGKVPYHFIPNSSSVKRTIRAVRQFLV